MRGIRENFGYVIGARDDAETVRLAQPFHLRDTVQHIRCPIALTHGTQDHICDFTVPYEVARRARAPVTVLPLVGVDHEAAYPATPRLAGPAVEWLRGVL